MIYLHRYFTEDNGDPSVEIAVVEDARYAERYEARGFSRCTRAAFRAAWRLRDERSLAHMREALGVELERERAVGESDGWHSVK
jgi:hypothetical protein